MLSERIKEKMSVEPYATINKTAISIIRHYDIMTEENIKERIENNHFAHIEEHFEMTLQEFSFAVKAKISALINDYI
jgi:hypothetical protein